MDAKADVELPLECGAPPANSAFAVDASGVTFTLSTGQLRLQVCTDDIVRVEYTTASSIPMKTSLSVNATWGTPSFCVSESGGNVTITTKDMTASVATATGLVSFGDLTGKVLLSEASKQLTGATVEGTSTHTVKTSWSSPADEALFGLGQRKDSTVNRKGQGGFQMLNSNGWIYIPLLVSNKGYGVYWDNPSTTQFTGNASNNTQYSFSSETGDMVDYYFFNGPKVDQVIAGYRTTTGAPPLFPKWAYGLFQSHDHYQSSQDLINVDHGYRTNNIPVDVIVQDWDYWNPYVWGSQLMDPSRYPDPASTVKQLHMDNIHTMISIWPLYQTRNPATPMVTGELDPFNALNALNALYPDTSGGLYHFYDTFNSMARATAYQYDYNRLLGPDGWDAIWADNDEPQSYPDGVNVHAADTALGKGAFNINAYPLEHTRGLYENWQSMGPTGKRVYILSRSGFAGQQRYAAGVWSGDISSTFSQLQTEIPGGLSYALSGMPYWTTDIGGYFTPDASEELFTRWLQFGAFCPTFRIHGQQNKELYGPQGCSGGSCWSTQGKANMLAVDQLRYRLMPYIYSLAWQVTSNGYTMMRPLPFDFTDDTKVYGITDQFMFGPAFLVSPVTTMGATSRSLYLPAGTWYDFYAGSTIAGGTTMTASAPLSQMPLYVRAGSIVPMGPMIQYATQSIDPQEIRVYAGGDASFTLYEDEGDTYDYQTGKYSTIPFTWSDSAKTLTIGARAGSYTGMPTTRTFNVVFVGANHGGGVTVTATPDKVVSYNGAQAVVTAN
jgi:alpha-D-xyloside xylohydrolase